MAKNSYRVTSPEGAAWASAPGSVVAVGDSIEKELDDEKEQALLAAGWLEPNKDKGKAGAS